MQQLDLSLPSSYSSQVDMRANIVEPPNVATRIKASIAVCRSVASCSSFGSLVMQLPASPKRDESRSAGDKDIDIEQISKSV